MFVSTIEGRGGVSCSLGGFVNGLQIGWGWFGQCILEKPLGLSGTVWFGVG